MYSEIPTWVKISKEATFFKNYLKDVLFYRKQAIYHTGKKVGLATVSFSHATTTVPTFSP